MQETPIDILVIDDDEGDIELLRANLEDAGLPHRLRTARSGTAGLRILREEEQPDVVLLDINMPGMDGHATLQELRRDKGLWHVHVIMFTTSKDDADIDRSFRAHADAFMTKPSDAKGYAELVARLREFGDAYVWQG